MQLFLSIFCDNIKFKKILEKYMNLKKDFWSEFYGFVML